MSEAASGGKEFETERNARMLAHYRRLWTVAAVLALAGLAQAAEPDQYLPKGTEQIGVINVQQLVGSALFKKNLLTQVEDALKNNKDYQAIKQATGLDLLRDVKTVVVGNTGTTGDKVTFIVRGKFDVDRIAKTAEAFAKEKKDEFKISKLGDRPLYEGTGKDGKTMFFTFIDSTTLVGSTSKDLVAEAVDGKGGKVNKDLAAALQGLDPKQSLWMAGVIPEEGKAALGQAQGPAEALKKVKVVSGGLNITTDVLASITLSAEDAKSAKDLGDFANQAKGLIAIAAQSNEMLKPFADEVLKTLKIQTTRNDVKISFKVSEDLIKKAIEMAPKQ
jgi:hypothetical protein